MLYTLAMVCFSIAGSAQATGITKQKFHWGKEYDTTAGYAQAILTVKALYMLGTVGMDKTMEEQLKSIYGGIERRLRHYGASFQNVVKENLNATDIEATKVANPIRKPFYKGDYPTAPRVQISRLYMPEALVEVKVVAYFLPK